MPIKINNKNIDTENIVINHRKIGAIISNNKVIMCRHTRCDTSGTPSTCLSHGYENQNCLICGWSTGIELPLADHKPETIYEKPTCNDPGTSREICSICNTQLSGYNILEPELGHDFRYSSDDCYDYEECARCGVRNILQEHHDPVCADYIDPTCQENGIYRDICAYCGITLEEIITEASDQYCVEGDDGCCIYCGREMTTEQPQPRYYYEISLKLKELPEVSANDVDGYSGYFERAKGYPVYVTIKSDMYGTATYEVSDETTLNFNGTNYWCLPCGSGFDLNYEDFENSSIAVDVKYYYWDAGVPNQRIDSYTYESSEIIEGGPYSDATEGSYNRVVTFGFN